MLTREASNCSFNSETSTFSVLVSLSPVVPWMLSTNCRLNILQTSTYVIDGLPSKKGSKKMNLVKGDMSWSLLGFIEVCLPGIAHISLGVGHSHVEWWVCSGGKKGLMSSCQ